MKTEFLKKFIDDFVNSYLATAAWVTCESDECQDFTREAKKMAKQDCLDFISKVMRSNKLKLEQALKLILTKGNDLTSLTAHDFFLTRNRHGAGFWDKTDIYGVHEAKILTEISEEIGSVDCVHIRGKKSKLEFC